MSNLNNIRGSGERVRKTTGQQVWIPELSETEERLLKKREFLKEKINQELLFAKKNSRANRKLALEALMRKRHHEKQLEFTDLALTAMTAAQKNIEFVHKVIDLMMEHHVTEDVPDSICSCAGMEVEFDEDELMAELEKLQENLDESLLEMDGKDDRVSSLQLSTESPVPAVKTDEEEIEEQLEYLQRWVKEPSETQQKHTDV
ncbi:charged multivesicular body protein 4c-like [Acanthochromis polyacanthus]|uniref:charged multivesicular body protein 4c-like n=1 Tax=Acanthochromis polyacanthus TaxID=80966 RepID=UPI000B8F5A3F|nr:charged multivesicular body protein 4c-like [Acanthochromis polyacanthus]